MELCAWLSAELTHLQLLRRPRHVARRRPGEGAPLAGLPPGSAGRRRRLAAKIVNLIGNAELHGAEHETRRDGLMLCSGLPLSMQRKLQCLHIYDTTANKLQT